MIRDGRGVDEGAYHVYHPLVDGASVIGFIQGRG
jgi:hypothetical protein